MGHHRFRLPLLLALPLLAPAVLAEEGPQRCNDEITRLMEIRWSGLRPAGRRRTPPPRISSLRRNTSTKW